MVRGKKSQISSPCALAVASVQGACRKQSPASAKTPVRGTKWYRSQNWTLLGEKSTCGATTPGRVREQRNGNGVTQENEELQGPGKIKSLGPVTISQRVQRGAGCGGGRESDDTLGWSSEENFQGLQPAFDVLSSSILPSFALHSSRDSEVTTQQP